MDVANLAENSQSSNPSLMQLVFVLFTESIMPIYRDDYELWHRALLKWG